MQQNTRQKQNYGEFAILEVLSKDQGSDFFWGGNSDQEAMDETGQEEMCCHLEMLSRSTKCICFWPQKCQQQGGWNHRLILLTSQIKMAF